MRKHIHQVFAFSTRELIWTLTISAAFVMVALYLMVDSHA